MSEPVADEAETPRLSQFMPNVEDARQVADWNAALTETEAITHRAQHTCRRPKQTHGSTLIGGPYDEVWDQGRRGPQRVQGAQGREDHRALVRAAPVNFWSVETGGTLSSLFIKALREKKTDERTRESFRSIAAIARE